MQRDAGHVQCSSPNGYSIVETAPSGSSGFTLVEVLLAAAMAVLVAGIVFSVYHTVSTTALAVQERRNGSSSAIQAMDCLARDLACAVSAAPKADRPFALFPAQGSADGCSALVFYTVMLRGEEQDDPDRFRLLRVNYIVERIQGRDRALVREVEEMNGDGVSAEQPVRELLLYNVREFEVTVLSDGRWLDSWPTAGGNALPAAARVVLSAQAKSGVRSLKSTVKIAAGTTL